MTVVSRSSKRVEIWDSYFGTINLGSMYELGVNYYCEICYPIFICLKSSMLRDWETTRIP